MNEEKKVNNFDVMKLMSERNQDIRLAALGTNLIRAHYGKHGTEVTIGVAGNVIASILNGKFVGGLILCDKDQFNATRKELGLA